MAVERRSLRDVESACDHRDVAVDDQAAMRWQGAAYAEAQNHHRGVDDWFLDRHPPRPADRIVDVGCGSGEFAARLARLVPDGSVVGVEPDASMLAQARTLHADNLEFRHGRLQELDRVCGPGSADLVVSRAVFHWIPVREHLDCYRAVREVLRPGGWLHTESAAAGNLERFVHLLEDVAHAQGIDPRATGHYPPDEFPHPGTVLELAERAGFVVPEGGVVAVAQRRTFDRAGLVGFLRTQASLPLVHGLSKDAREAFLAEAERRLDDVRRHDGTFDLTFVRLDLLAQRPS